MNPFFNTTSNTSFNNVQNVSLNNDSNINLNNTTLNDNNLLINSKEEKEEGEITDVCVDNQEKKKNKIS